MSLDKPYELNNPYFALSQFVFCRLREKNIQVKKEKEYLIVEVGLGEIDLFAIPKPGTVLLQFNSEDFSKKSEIMEKNYRHIHVTINHPLVKELQKDLDDTKIQFGEYRIENQIDDTDLLQFFQNSFQNTPLIVQKSHRSRNHYKLDTIETWFELKTKAGRGLFPIILTRDSNGSWIWSEYLQSMHRKRRGHLVPDDIFDDLDMELTFKTMDLESAKLTALEQIRLNFRHSRTSNGVFLRRLRQLRMEEMHLIQHRKDGASSELITHQKRKIDQLKKEINAEDEITLNSIVLLPYLTSSHLVFIARDNITMEPKFTINCTWESAQAETLAVEYEYLGVSEKYLLEKGSIVSSPRDFRICPTCSTVHFSNYIIPTQIGHMNDCPSCRKVCTICHKSISEDLAVKHSLNPNKWICPDHYVRCEKTGWFVANTEVVQIQNGMKVHESLVVKCCGCKDDVWHLQEEVETHSLRIPTEFICKTHTIICEISGAKVIASDVTELKDGRKVLKKYAVNCDVCSSDAEGCIYHLKSESFKHMYEPDMWLCNEHTYRCEVTQNIVREKDLFTLESGKRVAIYETEECFECKKIGLLFSRHYKGNMNAHSYNPERYLCQNHSSKCAFSGNIVAISEIYTLESGTGVAIQETEECYICVLDGLAFTRHIKQRMNKHDIVKTKFMCQIHTEHCDISHFTVSNRDLVTTVSGLRVLPKFTGKCVLCEKEKKNPIFLTTGLFKHINPTFKEDTTCIEHSFFCWGCHDIRPLVHIEDSHKDFLRLCPTCLKLWKERYKNRSPDNCLLCRTFSRVQIQKPNRVYYHMRCPVCHYMFLSHKNYEQSLPNSDFSTFLKRIPKKIRITYGNIGQKLTIFLEFGKKWQKIIPRWFLFECDSKNHLLAVIATNRPNMLKKPMLEKHMKKKRKIVR